MNATATELNHKMAALRERAEAAEAELEAVRDDNHSMMLEIHNLRIERDALAATAPGVAIDAEAFEIHRMNRLIAADPKMNAPSSPTDEQIHAAYRNALGQSIRERDMPEIRKFAIALLQSAPQAPAAPAPSVPVGDDFNGTTPHMIQCIEALVSMNDSGVLAPHGIGSHARTLLIASANRLRQQAAPSVPEEWREVMAELAADLQAACDAEHPHRDQYPSVMRKYQNDMRIVERACALLQSTDHSEQALEKVTPDCRTCANRGQVNGLSQESYCESCVYQGRDCRQNHFVDTTKMVDTANRRCEACAILPCSCK